jgi:hypothetical protein
MFISLAKKVRNLEKNGISSGTGGGCLWERDENGALMPSDGTSSGGGVPSTGKGESYWIEDENGALVPVRSVPDKTDSSK